MEVESNITPSPAPVPSEIPPEAKEIPVTSGIKNNKGKFFVVALYIFVVLISPLQFFTPYTQNQLESLLNSLVTKETDQFFKKYVNLLQVGDVEQAYSLLSPQAREVVSTSTWQTLSEGFSNAATAKMEIVGGSSNWHSNDSGTTETFDIYYEMPNDDPAYPFLLTEITAQNVGNGLEVLGVFAQGEAKSLKEQQRFNFASQGIYPVIAVLIPLFIAYTALRYILRARNPRWSILCLILLVSLCLNAGGQGVHAGSFGVNFGVYGFMTKNSPWGSWAFVTPIPLGALYYYYIRKRHEIK
jgi:hypothetical protein